MVFKSFVIQASIALVVITSSLTSSVNAAAAITPQAARFARDLPAPMLARFIQARDDTALVNSCTNSTDDVNCLLNGGALSQCESQHDLVDDNDGLISCLQSSCQSTSQSVIDCLTDPNKSDDDENAETQVIDPCTPPNFTNSDDLTCLRSNFELCAIENESIIGPNGKGFGKCMSNACPNVSGTEIDCMSKNYETAFAGVGP